MSTFAESHELLHPIDLSAGSSALTPSLQRLSCLPSEPVDCPLSLNKSAKSAQSAV